MNAHTGKVKAAQPTGNTLAMLKNVAACYTLVEKLRSRTAKQCGIGVFYGYPGLGKTEASIYVRGKVRGVLVEVGHGWTPKHLLETILHQCGVAARGSVPKLQDQLIRYLADEERPLIIDEADKLMDKSMIEHIRTILDSARVPGLLIGEENLAQKLERWPHTYDRVLEFVQAQPCDLEDARALTRLFCPVELDDGLLDLIRRKAQGRPRRIMNTLAAVAEFARNAGLTALTVETYAGPFHTGAAPAPRSV